MSNDGLEAKLLNAVRNCAGFEDSQTLRVSALTENKQGNQIGSSVHFFLIEADSKQTRVFVKQPLCGEPGAVMGIQTQFANEVNMYKEVLPALGSTIGSLFPEFFYGRTSEFPENDILILEDLRNQNFRLADDIVLSFDEMSFALKKLGEFHGLSYKLKKENLGKMHSLRRLLKLPTRRFERFYSVHFDTALYRGFKSLLTNGQENGIVHRAYEKMTRKIPTLFEWNRLNQPREPFALITHGDFNRNNIFFRYDETEKVREVKFFDLGTSLYSDPSIDLAFVLYMNTNEETRDKHWKDFLRIYWEALISVESDPGFSFEDFLNNFAKKAIFGYFRCSLFLPLMMENNVNVSVADFQKKSIDEKIEWALSVGGEPATAATTSIARHLLKTRYLEEYLFDAN